MPTCLLCRGGKQEFVATRSLLEELTPQKHREDTETQNGMAYEELKELTRQVIGGAIDVHKAIGPGFTERMYAKALRLNLQERNVQFVIEQPIEVKYKGQLLGTHRLDLVVNGAVVVELKSVYQINNFHIAQLISYLKASGKQLGLILNFGRGKLEIKRVAL